MCITVFLCTITVVFLWIQFKRDLPKLDIEDIWMNMSNTCKYICNLLKHKKIIYIFFCLIFFIFYGIFAIFCRFSVSCMHEVCWWLHHWQHWTTRLFRKSVNCCGFLLNNRGESPRVSFPATANDAPLLFIVNMKIV